MEMHIEDYPLALWPTAASEGVTADQLASLFTLDIREVRTMLTFTRDLLASRAIEEGYLPKGWQSKSVPYAHFLEEISRATSGHWSRLLTKKERDDRWHIIFVFRVARKQFNFASMNKGAFHAQG